MIKGLLNNITVLEKALDASWLRNESISNNIANIDTPNYKRQVVEFEDFLSEALDNKKLKLKTTNDKHISRNYENIKINIRTDNSQNSMRLDGNNVDIDKENALLAKNSIYYQAVSQQLSKKINKVKNIIRDIK